MKLHIVDYSWGMDRRTGQRSESEAANVVFEDLKVGALPPIGPSRRIFRIEAIGKGSITVFLSEKAGTVELQVGKPYTYRPMSLDGGHIFRLELE